MATTFDLTTESAGDMLAKSVQMEIKAIMEERLAKVVADEVAAIKVEIDQITTKATKDLVKHMQVYKNHTHESYEPTLHVVVKVVHEEPRYSVVVEKPV